MDLISSGGEQKAWAAQELQCQDTGKENPNLGAAGGRREVVKVLSITCLSILLVRAVWEPKTPTEDGNHRKLSWEMQFPPIQCVQGCGSDPCSCPAPAQQDHWEGAG